MGGAAFRHQFGPRGRRRGRFRAGSGGGRGLFGAGLATVAVALVSPLDGLAHTSLAAHMVQHVLLLAVAAALLVAAAPMPTLLAGLPRAVRDTAAHGWALVSGSAALPAVAGVDGGRGGRPDGGDVGLARPRPLRGRGATSRPSTPSSTLSFLGAGLLFWGALAAAVASRRGAGVVAMFVAALPGTALGAALTLAPRPWYPAYPSLEDQQLAGVVMWGFAGDGLRRGRRRRVRPVAGGRGWRDRRRPRPCQGGAER